jgi:phenylpyruvate tautomerase PptA (4-oxalocrotonate tautomerase family)
MGSMPIVDIEVVVGANGGLAAGLAQSLADTVGRSLKSPPGRTWVRLHVLAREHYAENESAIEVDELPVFVTVLKWALPAREELQVEVSALTGAIAQVLGRAVSCVHVEYAPAARGRLAFGGRLVE